MRRNFAQVLREGKIDLNNEYSKLYDIFYGRSRRDGKSIADIVSANFTDYNFRGTCLSLEEFEWTYGFDFVKQPQNLDIDYLVSFCEYIYNFILNTDYGAFFSSFNKGSHLEHIRRVIEAIGYMESSEDDMTIFVPKDDVAIAVSEFGQIPENLSYKIIAYNHHSMKRNLERKRQMLLIFADLLEPKRQELHTVDKQLTSDLFYAFNNFNIRHNNVDPSCPKYKKPIGKLTNEQLEAWYDEVYQMCLLAFMQLEHSTRKQEFDKLKDKIENKE